MGIMPKGSQHLSERPLPPSSAERDDDIQSVEDTDVIFSLGKQYLTDYYEECPSTPTNESATTNASLNSSTASTESEVMQDQVTESYANVVHLLSLYSSLKNVLSELEAKYSKLKTNQDELTDSISQLRALSLNFGVEEVSGSKKSHEENKVTPGSSSLKKSKSKARKKM